MIPSCDTSKTIVVPIQSAEALVDIGPTAHHFADLFDCRIELLAILHPEDDFGYEYGRLVGATSHYSQSINKVVELHVASDEDHFGALSRLCRDRVVCMSTSATPFVGDHYVGSHAAMLLGESRAPVILVGRSLRDNPPPTESVVVAVEKGNESDAALQTGRMIAAAMESPIAKLTVAPKGVIYESDYHDSTSGLPKEFHASLRSGPIDRKGICDLLVERSERSLLVMATTAKRGLAQICEGSVSLDVVDRAARPVVAVGPNADPEWFARWQVEPSFAAWEETSRFIATPFSRHEAPSVAAGR